MRKTSTSVLHIPDLRKPTGRPTDIQMIRKGIPILETSPVGNVDGTDTTAHIQRDGYLKLATGERIITD